MTKTMQLTAVETELFGNSAKFRAITERRADDEAEAMFQARGEPAEVSVVGPDGETLLIVEAH